MWDSRECVRNFNLRVQVYPGELWVSKQRMRRVLNRSLKISGCKMWCPKDLRVRAPAAPMLTHSLLSAPFSTRNLDNLLLSAHSKVLNRPLAECHRGILGLGDLTFQTFGFIKTPLSRRNLWKQNSFPKTTTNEPNLQNYGSWNGLWNNIVHLDIVWVKTNDNNNCPGDLVTLPKMADVII